MNRKQRNKIKLYSNLKGSKWRACKDDLKRYSFSFWVHSGNAKNAHNRDSALAEYVTDFFYSGMHTERSERTANEMRGEL